MRNLKYNSIYEYKFFQHWDGEYMIDVEHNQIARKIDGDIYEIYKLKCRLNRLDFETENYNFNEGE